MRRRVAFPVVVAAALGLGLYAGLGLRPDPQPRLCAIEVRFRHAAIRPFWRADGLPCPDTIPGLMEIPRRTIPIPRTCNVVLINRQERGSVELWRDECHTQERTPEEREVGDGV